MTDSILLSEDIITLISESEQGPQGIQGVQGLQGIQGIQGEQGLPGAPGSVGTTFTHEQAIPSSSWVITHNLGKKPSITIVDSAKSIVEGDARYESENELIITFSSAFAGFAYLN